MNLKKVANIKNIACLTAVVALAAGINIAERQKKTDDAVKPDSDSSSQAVVSEAQESKADDKKVL